MTTRFTPSAAKVAVTPPNATTPSKCLALACSYCDFKRTNLGDIGPLVETPPRIFRLRRRERDWYFQRDGSIFIGQTATQPMAVVVLAIDYVDIVAYRQSLLEEMGSAT